MLSPQRRPSAASLLSRDTTLKKPPFFVIGPNYPGAPIQDEGHFAAPNADHVMLVQSHDCTARQDPKAVGDSPRSITAKFPSPTTHSMSQAPGLQSNSKPQTTSSNSYTAIPRLGQASAPHFTPLGACRVKQWLTPLRRRISAPPRQTTPSLPVQAPPQGPISSSPSPLVPSNKHHPRAFEPHGCRRTAPSTPTAAPNGPSGPPWSSARCAAATAPPTAPTPSRSSPASCAPPANATSTYLR